MEARVNKISNKDPLKKIDTKEFELPETVFIRDIENRVFQSMVLQSLAEIEGVSPIEGGIIDSLLGRELADGVKGIHVEQDERQHAVSIKLEINVAYGISLPEKAEEIQTKVARDISRLTALHVSAVHVIFKDLIPTGAQKKEKLLLK